MRFYGLEQINNTIKPNKQDIKEIIRLKILEMQQEDSNTSIVAQDGKDINLKKRKIGRAHV